jgi:S1-C subfamily serine protease
MRRPASGDSRKSILLLVTSALFALFLAGCANADVTPQAIPTNASQPATATLVPPVATPTPLPTATATPTPAPLTSTDIFNAVSPAVAFIDTPAGSGSGFLIEDGYIVTNAHVVWPFTSVRVTFPDKTEFKTVPVLRWDLMTDIAVVGPVDTNITPLRPIDGEDYAIGSDVYLIGYPGEVEDFPQPTLSSGLISRKREWDFMKLTYFQTDAAAVEGQSGGVLVTENGEVIGIAGFNAAKNKFGMIASATDLMPRVQAMIQGEDVDGITDHAMSTGVTASNQHLVSLGSFWETAAFVVWEEPGTDVQVEITNNRTQKIYLSVLDVNGEPVSFGPQHNLAVTQGRFVTTLDAPYFILVASDAAVDSGIILSDKLLTPYKDHDDNRSLHPGESHIGTIDEPSDFDVFNVTLQKDETVYFKVESMMIDAVLIIDSVFNGPDEIYAMSVDADGVFGENAEITFTAPRKGVYHVLVGDVNTNKIGGYHLSMDRPNEDAPTPVVPTPTPTPTPTATPIVTEMGAMIIFDGDEQNPYSIPYPAVMQDMRGTNVCQESMIVCARHRISHIGRADFAIFDAATLLTASHEQLVEVLKNSIATQGLSLQSEETFTNANGLEVTIFHVLGLRTDGWYILHGDKEHVFFGLLAIASVKEFSEMNNDEKASLEKALNHSNLSDVPALVRYMADHLDVIKD